MKKRYWFIVLITILTLIWVFFLLKEEAKEAHLNTNQSLLAPRKRPNKTPRKLTKNNILNQEKKFISPTECLINKIKLHECDKDCFIDRLKKKNLHAIAEFVSNDWNTKPKEGFNPTMLANLYRALKPAGLLVGEESIEKPDYKKAETLIKDLVQLDHLNAFPAYFHALILLRQNKKEEATRALKVAHARTNFTSYVVDFQKQLKLATLHDPLDYFLGIELYSIIPMPSLLGLEELIELDKEAMQELGKRLTSPAEKYQGKHFDILWNPLEHQVGLSLLRKIAPDEAQKVFNYKEWMDMNPDESFFIETNTGCDLDLLKEELLRIKGILTEE